MNVDMNSDKITETAYLQRIVPALMEWYPNHRRDLPWRLHPLPYYVWISEVMLQQTRVETVIPYYQRFLKELPTVGALAGCPPEKLMKLWEGIGYYSRARNLQRAADMVVEVYGGHIPETREELLKLPGIGSYTASAISSIAYGRCEAAVDGNVLRVSTRLLEDSACIDEPKVKKRWEKIWTAVMRQYQESHPEEKSFPGTFNQAMMEIGATVCVPGGTPACSRCPLSAFCLAHLHAKELLYPVRKTKQPRRVENRTVLLLTDGGRIVIRKRSGKGLLAGMWELPNAEGTLTQKEALSYAERLGLSPLRIRPLPPARHIFTHIEWDMTGWQVLAETLEDLKTDGTKPAGREPEAAKNAAERTVSDASGAWALVTVQQAERQYAIPAAFSAYLKAAGIRPKAMLQKERKESAVRKAGYEGSSGSR